ncbi:Phosphotransferase system mannitol/fructose-specific IIA domain (Ntr-type) [Neorhodopirellula lusitana]|uniref:Phosphotransferase system mannitol/fructose-specific IIA domain (Ntr-type) n=2 Tax=Neorhodopirellula lusitana TaxID=445327 RepID=A0ABY1Q3Y6_9BACT|nr:PTS sugar transporter subunit IIA [Neorhodopirellula lusitana]SMP56323.1 Phosphotransferase system mannitol/fructose-specific IIA domain (Ntr-type) [Neorhodopirellula lusitana]
MLSFVNLHFDDPLLNMATVLVAGILGGEIFARFRLPKVTGWIATGILLRWVSLPGMDTSVDPLCLDRFLPYMHFVLGFIAFTVGATLYFASLRNTGKRIGLLLLGEILITPAIVAAMLYYLGPLVPGGEVMTSHPAFVLATIAIAGAPGTTVLVIQEARSRGILTRTLLAAIGLIDMVAVAGFVFITTILGDKAGWPHALQSVVVQFVVTFVIGGGCGVAAIALTRTMVSPAFLGPTIVAAILGAWGLAAGFGTSGGILACTFAGIVVTNLRHDLVRSGEAYLQTISGALFALFYTFAGMRLDFGLVPQAAGLVALYFFARLVGKCVSAFTAMSLAGVTDNVRGYLGISLLPHGGVAVGLILLVTADTAGFSEEVRTLVNTVGLSALAINQLLGPSATRFALERSGEARKDRARLLDFLQEHRITVGLTGNDREKTIRELTAQLYATSKMKLPQEEFIERVMARDAEHSTCLGKGLMIPHAILDEDEGQGIRGVLGISPEGLPFETPDGRLVHAVLLLATPEAERSRHLQVLSAFATAITRDANLVEQLYHARSAAHAYEVLHADKHTDINYFLEDAADQAGLRPT